MPIVASVDYPNKKIYLHSSTAGVDLDTLDIYREVRALRISTEAHRKFRPMIVAGGNIQKTATTFTAPYIQLLYGCEIIPFDIDQTFRLTRDTFSDDGRSGGQCFNLTGFANNVNIIEAIDKVEVREVATGGSSLTTEQNQKLDELWRLQGLKLGESMTVTPTLRVAGDIALEITGDGVTTSTVTRQ